MEQLLTGVILAGGLATRLPLKALLPIRNHGPAISSSIELMIRSTCKDIIIVVPPASPIVDVLRSLYPDHRFTYVVQDEARGVPDAIALAAQYLMPASLMVVSCCDNVYPVTYKLPDVLKNIRESCSLNGFQCVQRNLPPWKSAHLSKVCGKEWTEKSTAIHCVAGWLCMKAKQARDIPAPVSMCSFLNRCGIEPYEEEISDWWDIGTWDTYSRYWHGQQ